MGESQLEIIVSNITAINNSLEESFIKKLLLRLNCFGYKYKEDDNWLLLFLKSSETNHIKNICNIKIIPEKLEEILIDRIVGNFLLNKKQCNQLELDKIQLSAAVKSLQMGDANISFATGEGSSTDEEKLNTLINYLINKGDDELVCFRKLRW